MNEKVLMIAGAVGWLGAMGTVGTYALVSARRMDANSVRFQLINVVGGGLLAISALSADNWPSFASNLIWLLFGAVALHRSRRDVERAVVARMRDLRGRVVRVEFGRHPEVDHHTEQPAHAA